MAHSDTHGAKDGDAVTDGDGSGHNVWTVGSQDYIFCATNSV